jgi:hypothetical protein
LANANAGTPLNPNLTTQQLWNEFYQVVTEPKSNIESFIANQMMKFFFSPPAPGGVGADKQVIFNDMGVLAGDAGLVYNKTTDALTVAGLVTAGSATITGDLTVDTSTLKVDSTNNRVGIGTATPNYILDISGATPRLHIKDNGTGSSLVDIENNAGTLYVGRENSTGSGGLSGVPYAGIMYLQGAYPLVFGTNFIERARLNSTGAFVLAGGTTTANGIGVAFPTTQSASSDANCLDDYEEGTWTGTIGGTTTNPTTPLTSTGRYTKIGRQVSVEIGFYGDTTGASGRITVSALPFTSNASLSRPGIIALDTMGTFTGSPVAYLAAGVTSVDLYASSSNGSLSNVTHNAGGGRALYMELTYTV